MNREPHGVKKHTVWWKRFDKRKWLKRFDHKLFDKRNPCKLGGSGYPGISQDILDILGYTMMSSISWYI